MGHWAAWQSVGSGKTSLCSEFWRWRNTLSESTLECLKDSRDSGAFILTDLMFCFYSFINTFCFQKVWGKRFWYCIYRMCNLNLSVCNEKYDRPDKNSNVWSYLCSLTGSVGGCSSTLLPEADSIRSSRSFSDCSTTSFLSLMTEAKQTSSLVKMPRLTQSLSRQLPLIVPFCVMFFFFWWSELLLWRFVSDDVLSELEVCTGKAVSVLRGKLLWGNLSCYTALSLCTHFSFFFLSGALHLQPESLWHEADTSETLHAFIHGKTAWRTIETFRLLS